ncbi:MAG: hypothetical protein LBF72_00025 [Holosporales bacterium]|nr:hypothetical protein [Holosporales bacterium]
MNMFHIIVLSVIFSSCPSKKTNGEKRIVATIIATKSGEIALLQSKKLMNVSIFESRTRLASS